MCKLVFAALLTGSAATLMADEVPISKTETLVFAKPADFRFEVAREPDDQFKPSMKFSHFGAGGTKDFGFKLFVRKGKGSDLPTEEDVKDFTIVDCDEYKAGSVEKTSNPKRIAGQNVGFYCAFTDASIPADAQVTPGTFRNVTIGFVKSGVFGFNVIAYSNGLDGPLYSAFLRTLGSLSVRQSDASDP